MDVAALQASRARCLSVGQTSVDVSTYGGDLSAAIAARGAGKRYWLNDAAYAEAGDVVLGAKTILEGSGSGQTTLTLSSGARVVTDGFDALTGTNPAVSPGVGQFALRHLTVEGGGGVRIYGFAYEVEDVTVRGCAGVGFYSEWTNADNPIPPDASMETRIRGLKAHHCGDTGFDFNGPHDSFLDTVHSYFNSAGIGIRLGTKANGVHLDGGHAYGVDHTCAIEMLGAGQQVTSSQAEGADGPQVRILKAGSVFQGRVYSAQGNENVKGIVIGQAGDVGAGIRVDAIVENCWAGATGGTAKLVARGASGTVTTILDNIPA